MYIFKSNDFPAAARVAVWKYVSGKRQFQFYRNTSSIGSFVLKLQEGYYDFIVQGFSSYSVIYYNCGTLERTSDIVRPKHKVFFRNVIKLGSV